MIPINETTELIKKRRSLRVYDQKEISRDKVDQIIELAMRSPTAGNMMHYSILEVTDQEKKDRLVQTCDNQPFIAKAPLILIFLADVQRWFDYYKACSVPEFCRDNGLNFSPPQESDLMLASCDALIAAQTAVITAESFGIGSCYIGDIMENIETHREMFGLPDLVFPVTMLCFGYYKESKREQKLTSRFPQKYIHFKDKYERIDSEGFENMFMELMKERFKSGKLKGNAQNLGQHYYLMKTGSSFAEEMRRSVKVAISDWKKGIK